MDPILRHLAACNNADLPGGRLPVRIAGHQVGWLDPANRAALGLLPDAADLSLTPDQVQPVTRTLAEAGHYRWRSEAFDVRADPGGPVLATMDRGALPFFGVRAEGVHLNATVRRGDATWLWVARRARTKLLDPGKLDHLVAGGVAAGHTVRQTLEKEAAEEAGLPPHLLRTATHVATVGYAMARPEGLRRDRLHCFDVELPDTFTPEPRDGEVEAFELWPLPDVLARVRDTDDFKFNVNLVLIDLFQRKGLLPPTP